MRSADILTTPLEAYTNHTSPHAINVFIPWDKKVENKVFWRGSSTGDAYTKNKNTHAPGGWRSSHRPRLALMAQAKEGVEKIWVKRGKEWRLEEWTKKRLNEEYMDIGMTGHPHQVGFAVNVIHLLNWLMTSVIRRMGLVKRWKAKSIGWRGYLRKVQPSSNACLLDNELQSTNGRCV